MPDFYASGGPPTSGGGPYAGGGPGMPKATATQADGGDTKARKARCMSRLAMAFCMLLFSTLAVVYNFVFLGSVLPRLGQESFRPMCSVIFNTLWVLTLWSYIRAHYTDPGKIPERWHGFVKASSEFITIYPARMEWQPAKATHCRKCNVARPERAHHCTLCETCVLRMDHHCPWIGNCVGFRNHKFFILLAIYGCSGVSFGILSTVGLCVQNPTECLGPVRLSSSATTASPSLTTAAPEVKSVRPVLVPATARPPSTTPKSLVITAAPPAAKLTVSTTPPSTTPKSLVITAAPPAATLTVSTTTPPVQAPPPWIAAQAQAQLVGASTTYPAPPWLAAGAYTDQASRRLAATPTLVTPRSLASEFAAAPAADEASPDVESWFDGICMQIFAAFSALVEVFLLSLLLTHFPLACGNLTTIEENYDNMPNPFDQGGYIKNLAQIMGMFGPDWLIPITPVRPVSDGISYPRLFEVFAPSERARGPHGEDLPPLPDERWKARYLPNVIPKAEEPNAMSNLLAPLSTWWAAS